MIRYNYNLGFITQGGGNITVSVSRADDLASASTVKAAMDEIIAADIITSSSGMPRTIRFAELVKTETDDLVLI